MRKDPNRVAALAAALIAATTAVIVIGCTSESSTPAPSSRSAEPEALTPQNARGPSVEDWDKPAAALVISGETEGHLEPCGCSEGQKGGLGRRMDLISRLRAKGWEVAVLDAGNLVKDPAGARGGPVQARIKLEVALKAFALMKAQVLGLGAEDFKQGVTELLGRLANRDAGLELVCANARPKPGSGFEEIIKPSVVLTLGKVKVGVVVLLDEETFARIGDKDKAELFEVIPAKEAAAKALQDLNGKTDANVLLTSLPFDRARELAEAVPGYALVAGASEHVEPGNDPIALHDGATRLIRLGRKGVTATVVGIDPGAQPAIRVQNVVLTPQYKTPEAIRKLLDEDYQLDLKNNNVVVDFVRNAAAPGAPDGATYVGARTCKGCHPATTAFWETTKHAHALESLLSNPKRIREHDAECITCHTTGFTVQGGYVSREQTPHLGGNQCENCHGPGSKHAADPDNLAFRQAMHRDEAQVEADFFCIKCHDEDNSPKFQFEEYWPRVKHSGMDRYTDPKVHRGVTPKPPRGG